MQGGQAIPDSSYAGELSQVVTTARGMRVVTIDIETEWWSTRLFLLAYLLQDLTEVTRILVKEGPRFVGLLAVETIVKTLLPYHRELVKFDRKMRRRSAAESAIVEEAEAIVNVFEGEFAATGEFEVKLQVNEANLCHWFGEAMNTSPIRIADLSAATALDLIRLLDYPSGFVPVLSGDDAGTSTASARVNVIDTRALSGQLARSYVDELLDTLMRR